MYMYKLDFGRRFSFPWRFFFFKKKNCFIKFYSLHEGGVRPARSGVFPTFSHDSIVSVNLFNSSIVFPACRHILRRCFPLGTVGGMMARTISPFSWMHCANSRGRGDWRENMGERGLW